MTRYNKGKIKRVHWFRGVEEDIARNELHSVFHFNGDSPLKITVKEPIQITLGNNNEEPRHFGLAEIVSIKACSIADIEPSDFARQKEGYRSRKETINTLRELYPEYRADINMKTEISVITIRRLSYDLKPLTVMVKNNLNKRLGLPIKKE